MLDQVQTVGGATPYTPPYFKLLVHTGQHLTLDATVNGAALSPRQRLVVSLFDRQVGSLGPPEGQHLTLRRFVEMVVYCCCADLFCGTDAWLEYGEPPAAG